ncbi:MAG: 3-phosphoshikimate 1-carboxyvinyltransferase [Clostridiales bacterium]|nr:3-phosphoshikimate 1-carboxyvinyltransferase [Clostridiales bacterium]
MKTVAVPSSKSDAHRALISSYLSLTPCQVLFQGCSEDIVATKKCIEALEKNFSPLPCGESGSTFRFLLPVVAALGKSTSFELKGRLAQRPLSPLYEQLQAHGCTLSPLGSNPFWIKGLLTPGVFSLPGNISSQFITGLLMALPLLDGDSQIVLTTPLESKGYVDLTLQVLHTFGIAVTPVSNGFFLQGGQQYQGPGEYTVEGDWSNAAFWLGAGLLLEEGLCVRGLSLDSLQGDKGILDHLRNFGADIGCQKESLSISPGYFATRDFSSPVIIDAAPIPDLIPLLALLASLRQGDTLIKNAGRLRYKESDRLFSTSQVLKKLGAHILEKEDSLTITGLGGKLKGGSVTGYNDHRIVMMAAIASLACASPVHLHGAQAVNKSYPAFFDTLHALGLSQNLVLLP